jgi:hypothetical protein
MSLFLLIRSKSLILFCSNTSSSWVYSLLQSSCSFSTSVMLYLRKDSMETSYLDSRLNSPICLKLGSSVLTSASYVIGLLRNWCNSTWFAKYFKYNRWNEWIKSFFSLNILSYFTSYSRFRLMIVLSLLCFSDSFVSISFYNISLASMFFFFSFSSLRSNSVIFSL